MGSRDFGAEENHYTSDAIFIHDVRDALEVFGCEADVKVYVVSESADANGELISRMRSEGVKAECAIAFVEPRANDKIESKIIDKNVVWVDRCDAIHHMPMHHAATGYRIVTTNPAEMDGGAKQRAMVYAMGVSDSEAAEWLCIYGVEEFQL